MAGTHESFEEHVEVKTSSDRSFGLTVGGILAAIGLIRLVFGDAGLNWLTTLLLAVGAILVVLGFLKAEWLAPLNRLWTKLGLLLFRIVNPIVMFLIYAITVVPIGLIMRARGKDLLKLKQDPNAESYWIVREPPGPDPKTMIEQF
ncbi:MAG: hypothetical protein AAFY56_04005 [Pseudomonadota bacterium]